MNSPLWYSALLSFLMISCAQENSTGFQNADFSPANCEDCPAISISMDLPVDEGPLRDSISLHLKREAVTFLYPDLSGKPSDTILSEATRHFIQSYQNIREDFPDYPHRWEARFKASVNYKSDRLISIRIERYHFTGGSKGFSSTAYLNIDRVSGAVLKTSDLFQDPDKLRTTAEAMFREKHNISPQANINSTGFMFPADLFELPQSIGFSDHGIQLIYNPYEIAPFAQGGTLLEIPYPELASLIAKEYVPAYTL